MDNAWCCVRDELALPLLRKDSDAQTPESEQELRGTDSAAFASATH